jgi:hypothetical protein
MPQLDTALELFESNAPMELEDATHLLREAGVSSVDFDPRSLLAAATVCRRAPTFELETIRGRTRVVTTRLGRRANLIISIAYRQAEASGATNVQEVVAETVAKGVSAEEEEVRDILTSFSGAEFLEEDWFWRPDGKPQRNRLRNLSRKMLAVATAVSLETVREGLRREYKFRGSRGLGTWPITVPPRSVLRRLYERHPEFVIREDVVRSVGDLDYHNELRKTELIVVEVFRSSPSGVLDRASCVRGCVSRGMNDSTLSLYLTYSSIIAHLGLDLWSLRGVQVDPVVVEAVRRASAARPKERRVLDHGWTPEGRLWASVFLPTSPASFVFGIPGSIRGYLAGRDFPAFDETGYSCGTIGITADGTSYGYGPFLRRRGADEGDILRAEFDIVERRVVLELGDEDLVEVEATDRWK